MPRKAIAGRQRLRGAMKRRNSDNASTEKERRGNAPRGHLSEATSPRGAMQRRNYGCHKAAKRVIFFGWVYGWLFMGGIMCGLMARGFSRSGGRMRGGGRRAGRQAPRRKERGAQTDDVGGQLRGNKKTESRNDPSLWGF